MTTFRSRAFGLIAELKYIFINSLFNFVSSTYVSNLGDTHPKVVAALCWRFNLRNVAEVGVADGALSNYLLTTIPTLYLYGVDIESNECIWAVYEHFSDRAVFVERDSVDAAQSLANGFFDLVFIDADHTYDSVLKDIRAWAPKVRPGGILAGHDYGWEFPGVVRAVQEFAVATGWRLLTSNGNVWFLKSEVAPQRRIY